ncbi:MULTISPECIES: LiaF transmembrane domain-containing protein [unclassified Siphonobacter]|uniref:LiaF transmembrane domain-containing protein n=1 Tax=unclassified Siphonobacter TaxID=2635712 RepID=UPI000CC28CD6|nr:MULTISPECIES: DUF5668 domain-containing protein [unclassified Siphonobacter]MDQ1086188.1 hypothetical protein [Siphonobacter sp. SORGH_AS_1065]MDR6196472.1 hypothetical protein [Siphonobacter sp. SORGH_AS_0500]PKK37622.1 hypothetical protein BWI96_03885 [Siphonobacter sp. SORGH_AS_0500]
MKSSRVIVGACFIAFGLIKLGEELGFFDFDWSAIWRYWPILLISWGVWILVRDKTQPPYDPPLDPPTSYTHFPEDPQAPQPPQTPETPQTPHTPL